MRVPLRLAGGTGPYLPLYVGAGASLLWSVAQPDIVPRWCDALVHASMVAGAVWAAMVQKGRETQSKSEAVSLIQPLQILERQVHAGIVKSESAVMETVGTLGHIQQISAGLHSEASSAIEHSNSISTKLQKLSLESQQALHKLELQQAKLSEQQAFKDAQVAQAMRDVQSLTPLVEMIALIAKQTHLLSFNAAIEAARAGDTGNGFKIVATEVRSLAQQTTEAAKKIEEGITRVQNAVQGSNLLSAGELSDMLSSVNEIRNLLTRSVEHSAALGPFLHQLSHGMDEGTAVIRNHVVDALGQMQFQDVLRQLLEQVERGLQTLAQCSQGGTHAQQADVDLQALMRQWQDSYVMLEQHLTHADASTRPAAADAGPKIELF